MKKLSLIITLLFFITSCELTDVLDTDPPNNLIAENVLKNEEDAKALLNGAYTFIVNRTSDSYYAGTEIIPSTLIGTMGRLSVGGAALQFQENDLLFTNGFVNRFWVAFYKVIDQANNSITLTGNLPDSKFGANVKSEILGEAHYLRAMATFDALRYFGQFFDNSSPLGIVLRTEPANFVNRHKARSTVAECYTQIISDLDFAITNAPDFSVTYRASKTAAKALKAKVLLFQGEYAEAASLADQVINEGTRTLESDYESVFSRGLNSSEMIFMTHRDANSDLEDNNRKRFYDIFTRSGNTWFPILMDTDPRKDFTFADSRVLKVNNEDAFRPTYFLRLAEMYLIKAEGLAFSGAGLVESSAPLNVVRNRAVTGNTPATTIDELKDDIFNEIVKELAYENGSDWFAAIRFGKAMTLKPSITSSNQYILPIPEDEIFGNNLINFNNQNPGYDN
ncbi:MAG: RagB/SusD family nutrient uptake outer membrane protein [Flavobacteriaceae bacterium]|nr:RagB/SusD family nutrient uptake outer membrane protein [Flavobacteriaceae bacterium]